MGPIQLTLPNGQILSISSVVPFTAPGSINKTLFTGLSTPNPLAQIIQTINQSISAIVPLLPTQSQSTVIGTPIQVPIATQLHLPQQRSTNSSDQTEQKGKLAKPKLEKKKK